MQYGYEIYVHFNSLQIIVAAVSLSIVILSIVVSIVYNFKPKYIIISLLTILISFVSTYTVFNLDNACTFTFADASVEIDTKTALILDKIDFDYISVDKPITMTSDKLNKFIQILLKYNKNNNVDVLNQLELILTQ